MPRIIISRFILILIVLWSSAGVRQAIAQSPSHPDSVTPLKPNPYLRHTNPWRWDINSQLILSSGINSDMYGRDADRVYQDNRRRNLVSSSWNLPDFEFIFPVVRAGGFYWSPNEDIESHLRIDGIRFTPEAEVLRTLDSHAGYAWWKSNQRDKDTDELYFSQVSHIVSADTIFDEELAKRIPWPTAWPEDASRFLTPIADRVTKPIEQAGLDRIADLVQEWTQGKDPKSIDQFTLAKFLTGKVIEYVRVERGRTRLSQTVRVSDRNRVLNDGTDPLLNPWPVPTSTWSGFNVRSADIVAIEPSGSELDLTMLLTAVLRQAGVPARTVICFDNTNKHDQDKMITAIVEFAMYDEANDQTLWIPVDPIRLRDNGRRSNVYEQRWEYFGSHDRLHDMIPIAYYFHPPVNYKAYGYPSLYGIKTTPDIGSSVSQFLSIDVMNTPQTIDDYKPKRKP